MSTFRTSVSIPPAPFRIGYTNGTLSLGSCFAEQIGQRLARHHFPCCLNPFGIIYNPVSVAEGLQRLLGAGAFSAGDLFFHQGLWHSFAHHGRFSHPDREQALAGMNAALQEGRVFLEKTDRLLLTLGTAHVFRNKETGAVVANCHKLPGDRFVRQRLTVPEILDALGPALEELHRRRPEVGIVVTVSPVRHLRDGLIENQRSKAALLLASDALQREFGYVYYFPAYELVIDDLRDYRFFERDLAHPNAVAVDYVWAAFQQTFFDTPTRELAAEVGRVAEAAAHRPFHPETEEHQAFLRRQLQRIEVLEETYPFLQFQQEKATFRAQLL